MHLTLHLAWHGVLESHRVGVTAPEGTSGAELARELTARLGAEHTATVAGVPLERLRLGTAPLVDGVTVLLRPRENTSARAASDDRSPAGSVPGAGPAHGCLRSAEYAGGSRPDHSRTAAATGATVPSATSTPHHDDAACLVVAEGTSVGTRLVLPRGTCRVVLRDGTPLLTRVPADHDRPVGHSACPVLTMDDTGLRLGPRRTLLGHGDRLRVASGEYESWLRVELPGTASNSITGPDPTRPAPGFSAEEADPAHLLRVDPAGRRGSRTALLTGLLPLIAGIGIALVTGWWFFLLFSALGAVTSLAGWSSHRGERRDHRLRLRAALARDLRRAEHAAPSTAEILARSAALESQPAGLPEPTGASSSFPRPTPGDRPRCWVRLGHGPRSAQIARERGTAHRGLAHPWAPVLVDLAGLSSLTLVLPGERLAGVLDSLVVQLFTGPGALHDLVVSPGLSWAPPLAARAATGPDGPPAHASDGTPSPVNVPSTSSPSASPLARPAVLEVLLPDDAARRPPRPGVVRLVVATEEPGGPHAVLTAHGPRLRLTAHEDRAVPGLRASEQRTSLDFLADTVSATTAARAVATWRRAAGAAGLFTGRPFPASLGTHEIMADAPTASGRRRSPRTAHGEGARHAVSLSATFGVSPAGVERIVLDDENPHLLVAGTTGCGKSEVLRTLVLGLAAAAAPTHLEFVLVDFKGGAALSPLDGLPHPTTLLTDLGPDDVRRALAFLRAELVRRERVLSELGHNDMTSVLRDGGAVPALRHLVVVVDEAKMLTDAFPEASRELAVVATVGRSLGVHLVLATQRPQGALPADVRANVTQALCLRVRTEQESMDVLGAPAAARLPAVPGRGYLVRGDGACIAVQCAVATRMVAPEPERLRLTFPDPAVSWRHPVPNLPQLQAAPPGGSQPADDDGHGHGFGSPHEGPGPRNPADAAARGATHGHRAGATRGHPEVVEGARSIGIETSVHDVAEAWLNPDSRSNPASSPGREEMDPRSAAVPPPLPARAQAVHVQGAAVDLGPAENPGEHWCGRATWRPWRDGALLLIGRPSAVRDAFVAITVRCADAAWAPPRISGADEQPSPIEDSGLPSSARQGDPHADAVYIVSAGGADLPGLTTAEGVPRHDAVRGWARADHPADLAHLLARIRDTLDRRRDTPAGRGWRAVLAVDDWDRCCQVLRSGAWPHLEDELLALVADGPARGLSAVVAGDRSLVAGRSAQLGHTRLHFPAAQTAEALLQWPRLPPMTPHRLRAAYTGAGADRCAPPEASSLTERAAVVQIADGRASAPAVPLKNPGASVRALEEESPWPRSFPLPALWRPPDDSGPGLLVGVTRDGDAVRHPWGPGSTLLVAGPARSGRSTFLDGVQHRWHVPRPGRGPSGPPATGLPPTVLRAFPCTAAEVHALLREAQEHDGPVTVLIDDADALPLDALRALSTAWEPRPAAPSHAPGRSASGGDAAPDRLPGARLVLSVRLTDALTGTFAPMLPWRHRVDALLLQPRRAFDGDLFGASLAGQALGGPPGRGFWIHRGLTEAVQTAALRRGRADGP